MMMAHLEAERNETPQVTSLKLIPAARIQEMESTTPGLRERS